jgi:hypothetical protein
MADTRENTAASPEAIYAKIARFAAETDRAGLPAADNGSSVVYLSQVDRSRHTAAATTLARPAMSAAVLIALWAGAGLTISALLAAIVVALNRRVRIVDPVKGIDF